MANLVLCKKCVHRGRVRQPWVDHLGNKLSCAKIWCNLPESLMLMEWDTEVPDNCPYRLEHLVTHEDILDLAEESFALSGKGCKDETGF